MTASAHSPVPDPDECWRRWTEFLSRFGDCESSEESGVLVTRDDAAFVRVSKVQLHDYVSRYVSERVEAGLKPGLDAGLPNPLFDGFVEGFGSQSAPYEVYALRDWDLVPDPPRD